MTGIPFYLKSEASQKARASIYYSLGKERLRSVQDRRKLKRGYATALLILLFWQTLAVYTVVLFKGLGILFLTEPELEIVVAGTLAETTGLVYVIIKNLFPQID